MSQNDGIRFQKLDNGMIVNRLYNEKKLLVNKVEKENICYLDNRLGVKRGDVILKTIDSLSDIYQSVCKLKYVNGLKEREIAEVLDLPLKTVSLRIFRGKKILRDSLIKEQLHG